VEAVVEDARRVTTRAKPDRCAVGFTVGHALAAA